MSRTAFRSLIFTLSAAAIAGFSLACGDGGTREATPTVAPNTGSPTATVAIARSPVPSGTAANDYGPTPSASKYVKRISPNHASTVTQASTRSPNPEAPSGICADVTFEGLPENAQWFRMAVGRREVTPELTWIVASVVDPKEGRVCYAPEEGLPAGRYTAAISVQNPRTTSEPARETVAWSFDVK